MRLSPRPHSRSRARDSCAPTAHAPTRSPAHLAVGLLVTLLALALIATTAVAPSQAASAARRTLQVGPDVYVAGQAVTFDGALGRAGKQNVHLQMHMNRPGDTWKDVPGTGSVTDAQGAFRIVQPAPAMFNISYRVVSAHDASPAWKFRSRSQELILTHTPAAPGRVFTITADSAPPLRGGGYDLTPPVFAGRALTLQERVGITWRTLDTTTIDARGIGSFLVTAPTGGDPVYRVRAENHFVDGHQIGWFPSFPLYVPLTGSSRAASDQAADSDAAAGQAARTSAPATSQKKSAGSGNASTAYRWGASRYDFAWEFGESLDSRAYRGTRRAGHWEDTSDGTGRAVHFNGGLALQSQRLRSGLSDRGTTTATLQGNARRKGRWEFRLRSVVEERGSRPYHALVELVSESTGTTACAPAAITVADFTLGSSGMGIGVASPRARRTWKSKVNNFTLAADSLSVAVEVGRKHISWFANGRLVGTVRNKAATRLGKLTPRLSLVGAGGQEMNATMLISDWQRSWTLKRGKQAKRGPSLNRSRYSSPC